MWRVTDVVKVLQREGMPEKEVALFAEQAVVGQLLLDGLSEEDLQEMGVTVRLRRRAILALIKHILTTYPQ